MYFGFNSTIIQYVNSYNSACQILSKKVVGVQQNRPNHKYKQLSMSGYFLFFGPPTLTDKVMFKLEIAT